MFIIFYIAFLQFSISITVILMSLYIIFCYFFKRYKEPIASHQSLVIMTSLQTLVVSLKEFVYLFLTEPGFPAHTSTNFPLVWSHHLNIMASTLLLALYRYYRTCRPIRLFTSFFSTENVFYFFAIVLFLDPLLPCVMDEIACRFGLTDIMMSYSLMKFGILNVFYWYVFGYIVFAYSSITHSIRKTIQREVTLSVDPTLLKFSSSDSTVSYNTFVTSPDHRNVSKIKITFKKAQ